MKIGSYLRVPISIGELRCMGVDDSGTALPEEFGKVRSAVSIFDSVSKDGIN